jgi:transcriptional regulator with XRE-family HTH domain
MTLNKKLQQLIEAAQQDDEHWTEQAKIDFAMALDQQRKRQNMSLGELAQKLETSPAYITKVFRGDSNFTIDTMVKLARAVGAQLDIQLKTNASANKFWQTRASHRPALRLVSQQTTTTVNANPVAWDESAWAQNRVAA